MKGAMDKFVLKPQSPSENQIIDAHDGSAEATNIGEEVLIDSTNVEAANHGDNQATDDNMDTTNDIDIQPYEDNSFQPDIFDPRYWDSFSPAQVDILAQKGPRRDLSFRKGPRDTLSRRFSAKHYTRILPNGDECDRDWLVYSKELNRAFCFSCKLFTKGKRRHQLEKDGFNDWIHFSIRLKEHETSPDHVLTMSACLKSSCERLEAALRNNDGQSDIDAKDLSVELILLQKRSFSKLKLLKSFLRSTMTQERLNDLAMIALEGHILKKIAYQDIIEDFISKNATRIMHFK
ncbi:hypothetical protein EJB05_22973, partial [Eragrostis curvula]